MSTINNGSIHNNTSITHVTSSSFVVSLTIDNKTNSISSTMDNKTNSISSDSTESISSDSTESNSTGSGSTESSSTEINDSSIEVHQIDTSTKLSNPSSSSPLLCSPQSSHSETIHSPIINITTNQVINLHGHFTLQLIILPKTSIVTLRLTKQIKINTSSSSSSSSTRHSKFILCDKTLVQDEKLTDLINTELTTRKLMIRLPCEYIPKQMKYSMKFQDYTRQFIRMKFKGESKSTKKNRKIIYCYRYQL